MVYYFILFLGTSILATGLIFLKKPFFKLALSTTALLNVILDQVLDEDSKHKKLIRSLGLVLKHIFGFLLLFILVVILALLPYWVYENRFATVGVNDSAHSNFLTTLCLLLGSFPLFLGGFFKPKKDYSDWSILLHELLLDNYNLMRSLFFLEKRIFRKKLKNKNENFVIVTGLARSGTTAFNNLLYQTGNFHSLSYANMPFLLSTNFWKVFHNPKKANLKERLHGDKVMFGVQSIEALEEYFFKVFLNDAYMDEQSIYEHNINKFVYRQYIDYQNLLINPKKDTLYLAKNNNFMLRYKSLRLMNTQFKVALMLRHPIDHAQSLLNQHKRFLKIQKEDAFALQYMDWLGHHEFGMHTRIFEFENNSSVISGDKLELNFWLEVWINYYSNILKFPLDQLLIISYDDFLYYPAELLSVLSLNWKMDLKVTVVSAFEKASTLFDHGDKNLIHRALEIYNTLLQKRIVIKYPDAKSFTEVH